MTTPVLIAYASTHGSTREVAEAVAAALGAHGLATDVQPAAQVRELAGYRGVVLGGALYMGRLHRDARGFLAHHRAALGALPLAVFAMGPISLEDEEVASARAQLERALRRTPELVPVATAIFGGVIDPSELRFPLSRMRASDARDWDAIRAWADAVAAAFGSA